MRGSKRENLGGFGGKTHKRGSSKKKEGKPLALQNPESNHRE